MSLYWLGVFKYHRTGLCCVTEGRLQDIFYLLSLVHTKFPPNIVKDRGGVLDLFLLKASLTIHLTLSHKAVMVFEWVSGGITVFQAKSLSPPNTEAWSCSLSRWRRGYYWAKMKFGKVFFDDKSGQHGWSTGMVNRDGQQGRSTGMATGQHSMMRKTNMSHMLPSPSNQGNCNLSVVPSIISISNV